ncbi:hypothetical protein CNMCM6106_007473 [Aspergillus hiratsukae]|uniref:HAT C-terminal dimerisation domain-containing protein n=1 Tax=Aspergillus hiratsukae TaxID=1194566 RepID=A0A8H6QGT0_9EURO|nr:hypothetical protein CNMCM6106_007473 [Aspergillus hiratsukae]
MSKNIAHNAWLEYFKTVAFDEPQHENESHSGADRSICGDSLERPPSEDTAIMIMRSANSIMAHFRSSFKQLALLRRYQQGAYSQEYALTLACETRWGTQYNILAHLKRSKDALKAFARDVSNECDPAILEPINEYAFWAGVEELLDILKPIHEAQIASESSNAHLGYVVSRWAMIKGTLKEHNASYDLLSVFKARRATQLLPIHLVAFHLDPKNVHLAFNVGDQSAIFSFIKKHTSEDHIRIQRDFLNFRRMREGFESRELWEREVVNDPHTFWQFASEYSPELADLALRIFDTPANSVPSERAFSTMNLTHTRHRNRLKVEKVDKICYIHINRRILDRNKIAVEKVKKRIDQLDDEEALDLEESLPEIMETEGSSELSERETLKRNEIATVTAGVESGGWTFESIMVVPSGEKATAVTLPVWLTRGWRGCPVAVSQSRTLLYDTDASVVPSGEKATAYTRSVWPTSVRRGCPVAVSQSRTLLYDTDASVVPSDEKATASTPTCRSIWREGDRVHRACMAYKRPAWLPGGSVPEPDSVII